MIRQVSFSETTADSIEWSIASWIHWPCCACMKRSTRSQFIRLLKRLFWIAAGRDDRTVGDRPRWLSEIVKAHDISHEYHETEGGHTWINWRLYLRDFAQLLFR
jgi:enterochelin esterase-like enzyme